MRLAGTTIKEREKLRNERDEALINSLKNVRKELPKRESKRKSVNVLKDKIVVDIISDFIIRPPETFLNRSYNTDKQINGLIRHLFVKYPVPAFLYDALRKDFDKLHPRQITYTGLHDDYIMWFLALAQGHSFTKLVKSYMTSKEAFCFLSAPYADVFENVWWAKLKFAGIPNHIIDKLINRIFKNHLFVDKSGKLDEVIHFFARYHDEMDKTTLGEVLDFVSWKLTNDPDFRFKGRTASSVVKLTNEWHTLMQKAKLGKYVEWAGCGISDWRHETKNEIWIMTELLNNRELINEGRKQKHCVYSYVQRCAEGGSHIFSLRGHSKMLSGVQEDGKPIFSPLNETSRTTVELQGRHVVQIRGHLNQLPSKHDAGILRLWAGEKGVSCYTIASR